MRLLLHNAQIVTSQKDGLGALAIADGRIDGVWWCENAGSSDVRADDGDVLSEPGSADSKKCIAADSALPAPAQEYLLQHPDTELLDLGGKVLMAGAIDAHVHFREPGMTHKADIASESLSALYGGVTSFIDMPNTKPQTISIEAVHDKQALSKGRSWINYGFHLGATNDNVGAIEEAIDEGEGRDFGGVKVFMGSSTGNMLVDNDLTLERIFSIRDKAVLVHSEDENEIRTNLESAKAKFGEAVPFSMHPQIRSRKACIKSTIKALQMAMRCNTRLHVLHVSTAEEVEMIRAAKLHNPHITAETSANYLWFCDEDYDRLGGRLKCNPAVKTAHDREALCQALATGVIDTIGSDHAPHTAEEKNQPYLKCPSGLPAIEYSLPVLLSVASKIGLPLSQVASLVSEKPAEIFGIHGRGRIEPGFWADLIVVDPDKRQIVSGSHGKCGWTPYEGEELQGTVCSVFVNGKLMINEGKLVTDEPAGKPLRFDA